MTALVSPVAEPGGGGNAWAGRTGRRPPGNGLVATVLVTSLSVALVICVPSLRHWLMVPATLSGILIGVDAVRWFDRRTDIFEPRACAGLLGFQFLYVAPVLTVAFQTWSTDFYDPPDWPDAIGALAIFNVVGLCLYRLVLALPARARRRPRPPRALNLRRFYLLGVSAATLSMVLFFGYQVRSFGGVAGFVAAMTDRTDRVDSVGPIVLVTQAFPLIIFTLVLVRWRAVFARSTPLLVLLLTGVVLAQLFVAGLGGSRSSTLWPLVLGLVMVHLAVRRLSRKALLVTGVLIFAFLYLFAFFKIGGTDALKEIRQTGSVTSAESDTGRDLPTLLTADLGRADVQAVILHRLRSDEMEPEYGTTYVAPLRLWLPNSIAPLTFETKRDVGSRWLYNPLYGRGERNASKVYGMAGEGMLNFGLLGGLLSFAVYGLVVRLVGSYYLAAKQGMTLAPQLLAPAAWALVNVNNGDLGNIIDFVLNFCLPLVLLVLVASLRNRASRDLLASPGTAVAAAPFARPRQGQDRGRRVVAKAPAMASHASSPVLGDPR